MNLKDLQKIGTKTTRGERNFELKTALMKIFKALSWLFDGRKDVPEEKIAKTAEIQSKRLGLGDRYNWNKIFGNIEQNEQVKPQHISSTSNQVTAKYRTVGDGNCFFHAVFGSNSSGPYKTDKAQAMRQEWHKFLSQFKSLDDRKMPEALKERLSLIFYDAFPGAESKFNTSALYEAYLNKISQQGYFIRIEELPILASLANIEIELFIGNNNPMVFEPNPEMITGYKRNQELWGNKKQETIYLGASHYSRAEVVVQDKSTPLLDSKLAKQRQEQEDHKLAERLQQEEDDYELAMELQAQENNLLVRDNEKNTFQEKDSGYAGELLAKILQREGRAEFDCFVKALFVKTFLEIHGKDLPKHSPNCSMQEPRSTPHQQHIQQTIKGC